MLLPAADIDGSTVQTVLTWFLFCEGCTPGVAGSALAAVGSGCLPPPHPSSGQLRSVHAEWGDAEGLPVQPQLVHKQTRH